MGSEGESPNYLGDIAHYHKSERRKQPFFFLKSILFACLNTCFSHSRDDDAWS